MKKKSEQPPLTKEERVNITREAIKLAVADFLKSWRDEAVVGFWGVVKRFFWWLVALGIAAMFHAVFHGKYEKIADAFISAMSN